METAELVEEKKLTPWQQVKLVANSAKKAFTSDGCTMAPDFNFGHDCCHDHDRAYYDRTISRKDADNAMRDCIAKKGYVVLPWVYWAAVRVFGRNFWYGNNPS